jgi:hypothetical protein
VQPKALKTALCGIVAPSAKTALLKVNFPVCVCMARFYHETRAGATGKRQHGNHPHRR